MHLPSAGMIRFRFDGIAFASQPFQAPRGVAKDMGLRGRRKGDCDLPENQNAGQRVHCPAYGLLVLIARGYLAACPPSSPRVFHRL